MGPFRIILLAILFYLLYKLLFAKNISTQKRQGKTEGRTAQQAVNDVLVEDPICHTFVAKTQAEAYQHGETTYYFCSDKCRQAFINNNKGA